MKYPVFNIHDDSIWALGGDEVPKGPALEAWLTEHQRRGIQFISRTSEHQIVACEVAYKIRYCVHFLSTKLCSSLRNEKYRSRIQRSNLTKKK